MCGGSDSINRQQVKLRVARRLTQNLVAMQLRQGFLTSAPCWNRTNNLLIKRKGAIAKTLQK
jgi:hypothetical protein